MEYFDKTKKVVAWSSEETIIPYYDPVANRRRRYFVDFLVSIADPAGAIATFLIEVKPSQQCLPPSKPKVKTAKRVNRYLREIATFATNTAKWTAAIKTCETKDWQFLILTEKHLRFD